MSDEYDILSGKHLNDEERALLDEKVTVGVPDDLKTKIPASPDVSPAPKGRRVPGTFRNRIEGLRELRADKIPVAGEHFVVWGSKHLDDIRARAVTRSAKLTQNEYAEHAIAEVREMLALGIKDPKEWTDPEFGTPGVDPSTPGAVKWGRVERADHYARWRYRGYVCGEVANL